MGYYLSARHPKPVDHIYTGRYKESARHSNDDDSVMTRLQQAAGAPLSAVVTALVGAGVIGGKVGGKVGALVKADVVGFVDGATDGATLVVVEGGVGVVGCGPTSSGFSLLK